MGLLYGRILPVLDRMCQDIFFLWRLLEIIVFFPQIFSLKRFLFNKISNPGILLQGKEKWPIYLFKGYKLF